MPRLSPMRKFKSFLIITSSSIATYYGMCFYRSDETFYKNTLMPLVHLLEPETAHRTAVLAAKYKLFPKSKYVDPPELSVEVFGLKFKNPIGIAAGFDKNAEAVAGLNDLGFGYVEIGSVTPLPQVGNEKPRVFRLNHDRAIINRYGFNNDGHEVIYQRLTNLRKEQGYSGIIGVNLGKNKYSNNAIDDYVKGIETFGNVADYLVINVSSPNTPGLRNLQAKKDLTELLTTAVETRNNLKCYPRPALLLKIAPDLSENDLGDITDVIMRPDCRVDGLIISNTTVERPNSLQNAEKKEVGGLSGEPLKEKSTKLIAEVYKLTRGTVPIIGVGGIESGKDAYDKIRSGASVVQLYTSLIYHGVPLITKIKKELAQLLLEDGFSNVSNAVGVDVFPKKESVGKNVGVKSDKS